MVQAGGGAEVGANWRGTLLLNTGLANASDFRARISELEEENRQLRKLLAPGRYHIYRGLSLTRSERFLVKLLADRDYVIPAETILSAFERRGGAYRDVLGPRAVNVIVCRVRKKLEPHGIQIRNEWGVGYYMDAEDRAKLVALEAMHTPEGN